MEREIAKRIARNLKQWCADKKYCQSNCSVEEVAEDLDVTADQLRRFFLCYIQIKFVAWRKKMRINYARELLLKFPEAPLEQIGILVGINDKANFRRQFIEETGISPTHWKDIHSRKCRRNRRRNERKQRHPDIPSLL